MKQLKLHQAKKLAFFIAIITAISCQKTEEQSPQTLTANAMETDNMTCQNRTFPYPQTYTSFDGTQLNLFAWEGKKVMILSRNSNLNKVTMHKWLRAMDTTYAYYRL